MAKTEPETPEPDVDPIEVIRERWADQSWPNIGYFVYAQARDDIAFLLAEIDRLESVALSDWVDQQERSE